MDSQLTQQQAQQRLQQIQHYQQEVAALTSAGIMTNDSAQQQAIANYHHTLLTQLTSDFNLDLDSRQMQLSLGMKIASFIGALALSASVFFLFYQYWGAIATPIQIGILVTAPILFLLVSQLLKVWEPEGFFAKIVAMLALVSFVLNLAMLGQMFNINASPNAFAVWSVFAFILAYACNARLLLFFAIVLLSSFIAMEIGTWQGMYWLHFGERPEHFMLPAFGLFMLPIALQQHRFSGFAETYRICAMLLFFIATLILANYGQISYLQWSNDNVEAFYQVLGFVIAATLIYLGIKRQWPEVVATANVFFTLFLYTKVYDWFWHWLPKYLFFLLMALIAILALLVFKRLRGQGKMGGQHV